MNILVLSWRDPKHPLAGGAEQVMHEHMKGWIEAGHTVTFFSSRFSGSKEQEELDGVKIIRRGSDLFLGVQLCAFLWYALNRRERFDLVVDEFHGYPFFTPFFVGKPKLAILQEVAKEVWFLNPFPKPLNWIVGTVGYFTEPVVIRLYKKVPFMVGSESAKKELLDIIPSGNITVVPHGVLTELPNRVVSKEKTNTLIFLGTLTRDKGIEEAIKTFGVLSKRGKFHFWIIGKGEKRYVERLKRKCRKLKIYDQTKFWGFVDQKKKFELLMRAHVLINPSIREGWGLVNIEANSVGTPVVAYKSPGLVDSVKDGVTGVITPENTPVALAQGVEKITVNSQKYKRFQIEAKRWSSGFGWNKSRALGLKLIESIK